MNTSKSCEAYEIYHIFINLTNLFVNNQRGFYIPHSEKRGKSMLLSKQELEKAKERYITEVVIDDGSEKAKKFKKNLEDLLDVCITNWELKREGTLKNYDDSEYAFLTFAGEQLALITVNAIEQGIVPSLVVQVQEMLGGYLGLIYEMYFEEKVVGTC